MAADTFQQFSLDMQPGLLDEEPGMSSEPEEEEVGILGLIAKWRS